MPGPKLASIPASILASIAASIAAPILIFVVITAAFATTAQAQTRGQLRIQGEEVPIQENAPQTGSRTTTTTPGLETPGLETPLGTPGLATPGVNVPGTGLTTPGLTTPGLTTPGINPPPGISARTLASLTPPVFAGSIDYKEEMRQFVQRISAFAHRYDKDFMIIAQNGLELMTKDIITDEENPAPARGYMRALDGVLQEALYYGVSEFDKEPVRDEKRDQKKLLALADMAKKGGLKVLVMDYARQRSTISKAFWRSASKGYVAFVADARGMGQNRLPSYARWPFNENAESIRSIQNVKNYVIVRDSSAFGVQEEFVRRVRETNFDMIVIDVFHGNTPLTKESIRALKFKKLGARRLVLAYMDIGRAASYRHYWQDNWRVGWPPYVADRHAGNADKYYVKYWWPQWQRVIAGDTDSYIYGIIERGFDGVVLDGVGAYRFFMDEEEGF